MGGLIAVHDGHLDIHKDDIVCPFRSLGDFFYGGLAIVCGVYFESSFCQYLYGNLLVQFVIFSQQDPFPVKLPVPFCHGFLLAVMGFANAFQKSCPQLGEEEGLLAESGYAGLFGFVLKITEIIGGQDIDGDVVPGNLPQLPYDFHPAHIWQPPVYNINGEAPAHLRSGLCMQHGFLAGHSPIRLHANLIQHLGYAVAYVVIIVHDHGMETCQLFNPWIFHGFVHQLQGKLYGKGRTLALFAFCGNLAAHHFYDVLGDGHAKPGAFYLADRGGPFPLKGLEDMGQEVLAHANAGVADGKHKIAIFGRGLRLFQEADGNHAAGGGEFHGIAYQVEENPMEPGLVSIYIFMDQVHGINKKLQPLCMYLPLDHAHKVLHNGGEVGLLFLDMYFSALNAAHIQHFIDNGQKMLAGGCNLGNAVLHTLFVIDMGGGNAGEPYNGVHGGADVMGHVVEESRFAGICLVGIFIGPLQGFFGF